MVTTPQPHRQHAGDPAWEPAAGAGDRSARPAGDRRAGRVPLVAAGVALVVLAGLAARSGVAPSPAPLVVEHDGEPLPEPPPGGLPGQPSPLAVRPGGVSDAHWSTLPAAPVPGRVRHGWTWTGRELVVWGGRDEQGLRTDGAALDARTNVWRAIPAAPLRGRTDPAVVWTGGQVLVWGGHGPDGTFLADGAAYSPSADRWAPIAPPPSGFDGVWTAAALPPSGPAGRMLAWGMVGGGTLGMVYDLGTGAWRVTPAAPVAKPAGRPRLVALDDAVLLWAATPPGEPQAALYDPERDAWEPAPAAMTGGSWDPTLVWTGRELHGWGPLRSDVGAAAWRWTPDGGAEPRPPPNLPHAPDATLLWNGGRLIAVAAGGVAVGRRGAAPGWDLVPPSPLGRRDGAAVAWTGSRLLVWGGTAGRLDPDAAGSGVDAANAPWDGAALSFDAGHTHVGGWTRLAPAPIAPRSGASATSTDLGVVVLGGSVPAGGALAGARLDTATRRWTPVAAGIPDRRGHTAVWTGAEVLVAGGTTPAAGDAAAPADAAGGGAPVLEAHAYDPAADRWRRVAPPPLLVQTAVWDGHRVLAAGEALPGERPGEHLDEGLARRAAAWDPGTDTWTALPPPPAGRPLDRSRLAGSAWTGRGWVLGDLAPDGGRLPAFDPALGTWSLLPPMPASVSRPRVAAWAGLLVAASDGGAWAVFDGRAWREGPRIPVGRARLVALADGIAALAGTQVEGVLLDPAGLAWSPLWPAPLSPRHRWTASPAAGGLFVWGGVASDGSPADGGAVWQP